MIIVKALVETAYIKSFDYSEIRDPHSNNESNKIVR